MRAYHEAGSRSRTNRTTNMEFYIWSREHQGYWKQNGWGYTPDKDEAGRFSFEEGSAICLNANQFVEDDEELEEKMIPCDP